MLHYPDNNALHLSCSSCPDITGSKAMNGSAAKLQQYYCWPTGGATVAEARVYRDARVVCLGTSYNFYHLTFRIVPILL